MIKTSGLDEHIREIHALASDVDEEIQKEMNHIGLQIMSDARKNTPTQTGTLKRSFHTDGVEKSGNEYRVEVTNNTEYAAHVEYGHREYVWGRPTGKIRPGRYMLTNAEKRAKAILPARIKQAIRRAETRIHE
ncbi:MAG: HK97 gp10 family phage protein [Peptostreptococcaceae bacterium]|nr:HK97 gp10 family phage protein [Peptostreptococcaceae bacterium]